MATVDMEKITNTVNDKANTKLGISEKPDTSNNDKPELEKVIEGEISVKKKSGFTKFKESFFVKDIADIGAYIWSDVIVPAVKSTISDMVGNGIDMLLYGEESRPKRNSRESSRYGGHYVPYNSFSNNSQNKTQQRSRSKGIDTDYILEQRRDAEVIIDRLRDLIDSYGMASVDDLKDLVGEPGDYTDRNWGWTNLRDAGIQRVRDGYMLVLPKIEPLR